MRIAALLTSVALFATATHNAEEWCVRSVADISRPRPGVWVSGGYAHPGNFSRSPRRPQWLAEACPVQQRVFTCYRDPAKQAVAQEAEQRHFVPDGCAFRPFQPAAFLQAIAGRNFLFCCDSIAQQFFETVVCSLHGVTQTAYRISWLDMKGKFGKDVCGLHRGKLCHLNGATVSYPKFNASISVKGTWLYHELLGGKAHGTNSPEEYFSKGGLSSPRDVLVMNFGLHFSNATQYRAVLGIFLSKYAAFHPAVRPQLLWVETSPQHFNTSHLTGAGGIAPGQWVLGTNVACAPYANLSAAYAADHRNRIAEELCRGHGVPILRIVEASKTEWRSHMGPQRRGRRNVHDCTHFCQPSGLLFHWRELLYNALAIL